MEKARVFFILGKKMSMHDGEIQNILRAAIRRQEAGDYEYAERNYEKILKARPNHPEANFRMGTLAMKAMEWADAAELFGRAAKAAPGEKAYALMQANVLQKLRRFDEAAVIFLPAYEKFKSGNAGFKIAFNLINLYVESGQFDKARAICDDALKFNPGNALLIFQHAKLLDLEGNADEAEKEYRSAIEKDPKLTDALVGLCALLERKSKFSEALALAEPLAETLRNPELHNLLAEACMRLGRIYDAVKHFREALRSFTVPNPSFHGHFLCTLVASDKVDDKELYEQSLCWDHLYGHRESATNFSYPETKDPQRPLRVGILSAGFRYHTTVRILMPLLPELAKHFELFAYCENKVADDKFTARYKTLFRHWKNTFSLKESDAAKAIHDDGIDVLIDINGYLEDARPGILTYRPVPVQIHFMGGPMSLGLQAVQYRFSDEISEPAENGDRYSSEKILRLPGGVLLYQPLFADTADPADPPEVENGFITFGSCNAMYKATEATLTAWKTALDAVPNSRLEIVRDIFESDPGICKYWTKRLEDAGIPKERFTLRSAPYNEIHRLKNYVHIDIALDSFPYNGATTTLDALWMGVPVVTMLGTRFSSRLCASILSHVGLDDLVAKDTAEFGKIAAKLSADRPRRVKLRNTLRESVRNGPLGDASGMAENMAMRIREAWTEYCEGRGPFEKKTTTTG